LLTGEKHEVIVVDEGSGDETVDRADSPVRDGSPLVLVRNEANVGKGCAVRRGMLSGQATYVFCMGTDLCYPAQKLEKMLWEFTHWYGLAIA
jgi:glycosyltransferase involved in cell wall biosynthesis